MQVSACELDRILRRAILGFLAATDIQDQPPVVKCAPTTDECRVAAKNNKVAVSALSNLPQPVTIRPSRWIWCIVQLKTVPQHLPSDRVMNAIPMLPGYNSPGDNYDDYDG